jgi:hypothetical protein
VKHLPSLAGGHQHRTAISGPLVATSVATALAVFAAAGLLSGPGALGRRTHEIASTPAAHASSSGNVVSNGKFETGIAGWRTKATSQRLVWKNPGRNSHGSARLKSRTGKKVVLNDAVNSMTSATKGEVVKASVWVRAKKSGLSGQLRLKEILNSHRVGLGRAHFRLNGTGWTHVTLSYKVTRNGSSLDLNVVAQHVGRHQALRVDDISLKVTSSPAGQGGSGGKALLGMSAPLQFWDQRVSEVGSGLQARRLFFTSFGASLGKATEACHDGMYPVISFKTGSYTWAQVAAGDADAALKSLHTRLGALPCHAFVAVHHEPATDGTAAAWAKMQVHALPILGGPVGGNIKVGVIGNGWWFSPSSHGLTDSQIAAYITPGVKKVSDVIASDTYQMTSTSEEAAPKITGMAAWARRTGGVKALGLGEFNAATASAITHATTALGNDHLYAWGCLWNADLSTVTVLSGARLTAFRTALAGW